MSVIKEVEMYPPVKQFLEEKGYEVYAEVARGWGHCKRADVVGYIAYSDCSCIVEMKTSLTMDLVQQAYEWTAQANYVYIAIPKRKKPIHPFLVKILSQYKIGVLQVGIGGYEKVTVSVPAKFQRVPKHNKSWKDVLKPEHQTWVEGGNSGGGYVTDYKLTIDKVRSYLRFSSHRWVPLTEILEKCETHYSSPRSSLAKALREFEHEWCTSQVINRKLHFRYKGG